MLKRVILLSLLTSTVTSVASLVMAADWNGMNEQEKLNYLKEQLDAQRTSITNNTSSINRYASQQERANRIIDAITISQDTTTVDNHNSTNPKAIQINVHSDFGVLIGTENTYKVGTGTGYVGVGANITVGHSSAAIGDDVHAPGWTSVAMGYQTVAAGMDSVVVGTHSLAYPGLFGKHPFLRDMYGTPVISSQNQAIGTFARASGLSTAVGTAAKAYGLGSLALGPMAVAGGDFNKLKVESNGVGVEYTVDTSTISNDEVKRIFKPYLDRIGYEEINKRDTAQLDNIFHALKESIAVDDSKGYYSAAIGMKAIANGTSAYALGTEAHGVGDNTISIGNHANAIDKEAYAYGARALAKGKQSLAIGSDAQANHSLAMAIGSQAAANISDSLAVGNYAQALVEHGVALGTMSVANRNAGLIGYDVVAKDTLTREAVYERAGISEAQYTANQEEIATLKKTLVKHYTNKVALDEKINNPTHATNPDKAKWEEEAKKLQDEIITVQDKLAKKVKENQGINAWISTSGALSVGDEITGITRQIANVAAGSEDTDAVNVAQLKYAMAHAGSKVHWLNVNSQKPIDAALEKSNYDQEHSGALGLDSIAIGHVKTEGEKSIYIGGGVKSPAPSGNNTIMVGYDNTFDRIIGQGTVSMVDSALIGHNNHVTIHNNRDTISNMYILGDNNSFQGDKGILVGSHNELESYYTSAVEVTSGIFGNFNTSKGNVALVTGFYNQLNAGDDISWTEGLGDSTNDYKTRKHQMNIVFGTANQSGTEKKKNTYRNVLLGIYNRTSEPNNVMVGIDNHGGGNTAIAFGIDNELGKKEADNGRANNAIALGISNKAHGPESIAIGRYNRSVGDNSITFGVSNTNNGDLATLSGYENKIDKDGVGAYVGGLRNYANGMGVVSLGVYNNVKLNKEGDVSGYLSTGNYSVAVGTHNKSLATRSVAVGTTNTVTSNYSNAVGSYNVVGNGQDKLDEDKNNTYAQAFGAYNSVKGKMASAFGLTNKVNALYASTFGIQNIVVGKSSVALGSQNIVVGQNSIALGKGVIIGKDPKALSKMTKELPVSEDIENAFAGGTNARVTLTDGIALGSYAKADRASAINGYDVSTGAVSTNESSTWKSTLAALSIGDVKDNKTRQITGVAAGLEDTDAVNVAQLKALATKVENSTLASNTIELQGDTGNTDKQALNKEGGIAFKITGGADGDIQSNASGSNVTLTIHKENVVTKDGKSLVNSGAIYNAIAGAKTTLSGDDYIKVTPTLGEGLVGNSYTIELNADTLKENLKGSLKDSVTTLASGDKYIKVVDNNKDTADGKDHSYTISLDTSLLDKINQAGGKVITYKANGERPKSVDLTEGLNFTNGTNTTATIGEKGVITYHLNSELQSINRISNGTSQITLAKDSTITIESGKAVDIQGKESLTLTGGDKTISITNNGLDLHANKLVNVAMGTAPTDGVNVSQLEAQGEAIKGYTDKGHALSAALSALKPLGYDPNRQWEIMAGIGTYKGEQGVALGIAYHRNRDILWNSGLAYNGSNMMWNMGLSMRLGNQDKEGHRVANGTQDYILDRFKVLEAQNKQLEEDNKSLHHEIGELKKVVQSLLNHRPY